MGKRVSDNGHSTPLVFAKAPKRVVSLVPSMTESIVDIGAGEALVGVTDYCILPDAFAERIKRVGGTRTLDVDAVILLNPELVIANQEENTREAVEAMENAEIKVWVTLPRSVDDAIEILWALVKLFRVEELGAPKIKTLEVTLDWTSRAASSRQPVRVFCPIWRGETRDTVPWWMTFNRDTYCHDVLSRCGGANIFADRERQYPLLADLGLEEPEALGERDQRYPRVLAKDVLAEAPEVILLPNEPYAFGEAEEVELRDLLASTPAVRQGKVYRVEGNLITWHGTRLARALAELPVYLQP